MEIFMIQSLATNMNFYELKLCYELQWIFPKRVSYKACQKSNHNVLFQYYQKLLNMEKWQVFCIAIYIYWPTLKSSSRCRLDLNRQIIRIGLFSVRKHLAYKVNVLLSLFSLTFDQLLVFKWLYSDVFFVFFAVMY